MYRLVWSLFLLLPAITLQMYSDNIVHFPSAESSDEQLLEEVQESQVSFIVEDYETNKQILALLRNIKQEMRQMRAQSQKAIADNHAKQEQSIHLLVEIQKEIQNHQKEIEKGRVQVAKWQSEMQTSIRTYQIETANVLKEVLGNIATIQATQNQSIELLNSLKQEVQQLKKEETKVLTECKPAMAEVKDQQNVQLLNSWPQTLLDTNLEMFKQRALLMEIHNAYEMLIVQLQRDNTKLRSTLLDVQLSSYQTCKDVPVKVSGKYNIRGNDTFSTFEAYCEQQEFGGGWMVIQHRFDGSLSFDRNWTDYRNGFGVVGGELWLGLERIYQFTKEHDCELLIEMKDFYDNFKYARYSSFAIGSECEQYNLAALGEFCGTVGDSLSLHIGMKFSTPDRDTGGNCAKVWRGGWWFDHCYSSFLNGIYRNSTTKLVPKIDWVHFSDDDVYYGLSYVRMMIRPQN
uniref:Putative ficolin n=1 Tax=Anopheles darlingi TaxID=43151 RepID=A0A2M4DJ98_ANODA